MFLPWPKTFPGAGPTAPVVAVRAAGGVAPEALHAGVHVGLVVVADEEHVVVTLEHPRQAPEPDVDRAAVAALADDANVGATLHLEGSGDARRYSRRVAEQGMDPGQLPRRLGIRS
jgi:hypothetical protein